MDGYANLDELGAQLVYLIEKIGEARYGGQLFNISTDRVRSEKKVSVSLYLDELLDKKVRPGTAASCSTLRPTG